MPPHRTNDSIHGWKLVYIHRIVTVERVHALRTAVRGSMLRTGALASARGALARHSIHHILIEPYVHACIHHTVYISICEHVEHAAWQGFNGGASQLPSVRGRGVHTAVATALPQRVCSSGASVCERHRFALPQLVF